MLEHPAGGMAWDSTPTTRPCDDESAGGVAANERWAALSPGPFLTLERLMKR
ncbi:MAG TPA: hypothetical protein VFU63_12105 [Ktedonobacterales bacterium]|nr:hypothetical protein [Ktedonobacterales bacterium]